MAGVKGRSGGARPNSGGARPGSGRKPKPKPIISIEVLTGDDPRVFLVSVMNDPIADARLRLDAAKALLPYVAEKPGEAGKKQQRAQAAKKVSGGKFASVAPPLRLVS